jgi:hypothetical protein
MNLERLKLERELYLEKLQNPKLNKAKRNMLENAEEEVERLIIVMNKIKNALYYKRAYVFIEEAFEQLSDMRIREKAEYPVEKGDKNVKISSSMFKKEREKERKIIKKGDKEKENYWIAVEVIQYIDYFITLTEEYEKNPESKNVVETTLL